MNPIAYDTSTQEGIDFYDAFWDDPKYHLRHNTCYGDGLLLDYDFNITTDYVPYVEPVLNCTYSTVRASIIVPTPTPTVEETTPTPILIEETKIITTDQPIEETEETEPGTNKADQVKCQLLLSLCIFFTWCFAF